MLQTAVVFGGLFAPSKGLTYCTEKSCSAVCHRWSKDADSLLFEDCLFQNNKVGGAGGGAGHLTGTARASSWKP